MTDKCNIFVNAGITKESELLYQVIKVVEPSAERDLALLKMDTPIETSDKSRANSICLPKAFITNPNPEYGLIAGWGLTKETVDSEGRPVIDVPRERPRIGWTVIMEDGYFPDGKFPDAESLYTRPVPFPGGARGCSVNFHEITLIRL